MNKEQELTLVEKLEIQRDIDYWRRKFYFHQKSFLVHLQDKELSSFHAEKLARIDRTLLELKQKRGECSTRNLRYVIHECMNIKGWSKEFMAQRAGVSVEIINECLSIGFLRTPEHTHFGMWAIREFDLDANSYIQYFTG